MRRPMVVLALIIWSLAGSAASAETRPVREDSDTHCSGDTRHNEHDYPLHRCVRAVNPHYATQYGGGEACSFRAKNCSSCYDCCDLQRLEAESCHCFEPTCRDQLPNVQRTCYHSCVGKWIETCAPVPPIT